jgi:enoyl-CoA hydratase/carnithine racemase
MAAHGSAGFPMGTGRPFSDVTKPIVAAVNGYALADGTPRVRRPGQG